MRRLLLPAVFAASYIAACSTTAITRARVDAPTPLQAQLMRLAADVERSRNQLEELANTQRAPRVAPRISQAASPSGGREWHTCSSGGFCEEGSKCTADGCEWCGDGDGVATACTEGSD